MALRMFKNTDIYSCVQLVKTEWLQLSKDIEHDINLYLNERNLFEPIIMVEELDGKVVGLLILVCSLMSRDFYELELVIVHPDYRNRGIAKRLIDHCLFVCDFNERGLVFVTDKPEFYKKLGFVHIYNYCDDRYIIFTENKNAKGEI